MRPGEPEPEAGAFQGTAGVGLRYLAWRADASVGAAVVVHGLGEHAGRYREVARALAGAGIDVLAYDQRGHGRSGGRRGHADRFADLGGDLDRAFAEAVSRFGRSPRLLLGHSLGGLLALWWCQERSPDLAGVVLSAPWLATAAPVPSWKRLAGRLADRVAPGLTLGTGLTAQALTSDPAMIALYDADPLVHTRISARLHAESERTQARVLARPERVKVPCLFLVPGADPVADADATRAFATAVPEGRATCLELPGLLHEPLHERGRTELISRVATWMRDRLEA